MNFKTSHSSTDTYMSRIARVVIPGLPYHVTQRGNRREDVFFCEADWQKYLDLVLEYSVQFGLQILAYCLMTNHLHLVCIPLLATSLSKVFKPVHSRYVQYFNKRLCISGRLWQGRFFSCPMDNDHLRAAIRYVERNPVRAGIVSRAEDYPWSSAAAHCSMQLDRILSPLPELGLPQASKWSSWLADPEDERLLKRIRHHTRTGRPIGDDQFVKNIEACLGRRVHAMANGRPRKRNSTITPVQRILCF
jgi:putative transposase